jgi:hypothetical protein
MLRSMTDLTVEPGWQSGVDAITDAPIAPGKYSVAAQYNSYNLVLYSNGYPFNLLRDPFTTGILPIAVTNFEGTTPIVIKKGQVVATLFES